MAARQSDMRTGSVRPKALCDAFARSLVRWPFALLIFALFVSPLAACGKDRAMQNASIPPAASPTPTQNSSPEVQPCSNDAQQPAVPVYTYEVVNTWPHDTSAFTQGLVFYQGVFYESAGRYGSSSLRRVEPVTGKVAKKVSLGSQYFAEGMTILKEKIYQLTWMEHKGFIYDLKNLRLEGEFAFDGEGWGLADDEQSLIMSDGTNRIRFIDPSTFKVSRSIMVCEHGAPLMELNELEFVKGEIFANLWKSDRIARIDPQNGHITGWIDLTNLLPPEQRVNPEEDVLNGIAYDEKDDRLFVTGKRWPKIFEIRLKKTS
jgi:glutamine cyclotransferase